MVRRLRQHGQIVGDPGHDVPRLGPVEVVERETLEVDKQILPHRRLHARPQNVSPAETHIIRPRDQQGQNQQKCRRRKKTLQLHFRQIVVEHAVNDHRQKNGQRRLRQDRRRIRRRKSLERFVVCGKCLHILPHLRCGESSFRLGHGLLSSVFRGRVQALFPHRSAVR